MGVLGPECNRRIREPRAENLEIAKPGKLETGKPENPTKPSALQEVTKQFPGGLETAFAILRALGGCCSGSDAFLTADLAESADDPERGKRFIARTCPPEL
jgi:hypothetical protein